MRSEAIEGKSGQARPKTKKDAPRWAELLDSSDALGCKRSEAKSGTSRCVKLLDNMNMPEWMESDASNAALGCA